ncbi:DUF927 domain-containing protein [Pararobbsia silviterrae]|uniref:DUF927 domain-containing protein n=1 Tax=Pararobbsia silviterrae TaxID=1792498 RepID=A0A494Y7F1_9BURK|nr:DUF927 domain-containing protein [Pararobbsia silviterrae]RKP58632.1 DUF927 domain-containing protein [Pararobbsia silviterrae]
MSAILNEEHRIKAALACIPPTVDREQWFRIAASLKHELGGDGFEIFDAWSQGADSYSATAARDTWRSLKADGGITIGTLYALARKYGFDTKAAHAPVVDPSEIELRRAERAARTQREADKRLLGHSQAATHSLAVWSKAMPARDDHEYLMRKGLASIDTLREIEANVLKGLIGYAPKSSDEPLRGRILVAGIRIGETLKSLEFIDGAGRKSALAGGEKSGGYWIASAPGEDSPRILIAEGVATALSAHQCTGDPAVAALTCGNLTKAAQAMHEAYPNAQIVILGDLGNGANKATEAARTVGGRVVFPDFGAERRDDQTDFNDLHVEHGKVAVKHRIDEAAEPAADDRQPDGDKEPGSAPVFAFPSLEERPCWRIYQNWERLDGRKVKPGVYSHGVKHGRSDGEPELVDKWICSPLWVCAITRNREDGDYGRLLEILSPSGRLKKWSMPMSMLAGDGNDVRAVLLSEGVLLDLRNRGGVTDYIIGQHPNVTMRAASMTGWHDGAFVLPDLVIGANDIWFQASGRTASYASAGTFEGWQDLAALANGNPLLMFAMSAAFAGPLLHPLNIDGGGAHLFGDSSSGKTTALMASISVWGGPAFKRTWRATANGLEGAGGMHSDTLLALDEIGEIDPRNLYESAYALINGVGKTRANRTGEARQAARWRVFLMSTGELTVSARMGAGGIEAKAGQAIRILDVPVSGRHGVFDELHGRVSGGVLSDEVRNLAAKHYGHAGPRFVEKLIEKLAGGLRLPDSLDWIMKHFPDGSDQERRAARTFALCALAGELSASWGITPWEKESPLKAALHAFNLWRGQRASSAHGSEHASILRAVADFIDRHGDSRFSSIEGSADLVRDRAGYWKQHGEGRRYLFTSGGLREATKGYDFARSLKALDDAGVIVERDAGGGKRSKKTRIPGGEPIALYHIDRGALGEGL